MICEFRHLKLFVTLSLWKHVHSISLPVSLNHHTLHFWKYITHTRHIGYCIFVYCSLGVILISSEERSRFMSVWILLPGSKLFMINVWAAYWCGNLASLISRCCIYQNHLGELVMIENTGVLCKEFLTQDMLGEPM